MAKLVWRVKLVAELEPGNVSETEVARIERDDYAVSETLGLTLDKSKRLTAATQAAIVRAQVSTMGERFRWCEHCGQKLLEHFCGNWNRLPPGWGFRHGPEM